MVSVSLSAFYNTSPDILHPAGFLYAERTGQWNITKYGFVPILVNPFYDEYAESK
jgi:hypothetical protein